MSYWYCNIKVTSHEHHGRSKHHQQLDCLFNSLCMLLLIKKTSKHGITQWPVDYERPVIRKMSPSCVRTSSWRGQKFDMPNMYHPTHLITILTNVLESNRQQVISNHYTHLTMTILSPRCDVTYPTNHITANKPIRFKKVWMLLIYLFLLFVNVHFSNMIMPCVWTISMYLTFPKS